MDQLKGIVEKYREAFPEAMKCLEKDLEECLISLKLPLAHRRQTRTTNLLERLFGEGKRRSKVIPRFNSEAGCLSLLFAVLVDASEGWRGVRMTPALKERIAQMRQNPDAAWEDPDAALLVA